MRNSKITLAAATGVAMALAACDNEPDTAATDTEMADSTMADGSVNTDDEFNPLERDYTLSDEARERRAEFDMDAFNREYSELQGDSAQAGNANTGNTADTTASDSGTTANDQTGSNRVRDRSAMSWSYLDRNSDGRLSVAEYAIWAIPLDPTAPKPNDETAPYVTADQANRAADSFFYYDTDGDTYLSQSEFADARRGADVG